MKAGLFQTATRHGRMIPLHNPRLQGWDAKTKAEAKEQRAMDMHRIVTRSLVRIEHTNKKVDHRPTAAKPRKPVPPPKVAVTREPHSPFYAPTAFPPTGHGASKSKSRVADARYVAPNDAERCTLVLRKRKKNAKHPTDKCDTTRLPEPKTATAGSTKPAKSKPPIPL